MIEGMSIDNKYNKEYFLRLQELYFEAETTEEQEQELMRFVAATDDNDFRELKAVMGFAVAERSALGRVQQNTMRPVPRFIRYAAAAVVVMAVGVSAFVHFSTEPDCVAYVGGKRVTDKAEIEQLMHSTIDDMRTENIAEAQLRDMLMEL